MTVTAQQVAALNYGDVITLTGHDEPGVITTGPVSEGAGGSYWLGARIHLADFAAVNLPGWARRDEATLTVVSRAPRPLYVNSNRTEPASKDVVRDGEGVVRYVARTSIGGLAYWSHDYEPGWGWTHHSNPPKPLTLLVDGTTGQVVP